MKSSLLLYAGLLFYAARWGVAAENCPEAALLAPKCRCDERDLSLTCVGLDNADELSAVFQRPFPVERLWRLTVRHARLDHLRADHLANKSFVAILFQNVSLQRIEEDALAVSSERLRTLAIDSSPSLQELSVAGLARMDHLVGFEVTMSGLHSLVDFPSLPNLQYLHLYGNRLETPPALPYLPKLHSIWLNSGQLTSTRSLNLVNVPNLRKLALFGNRLQRLATGDLVFVEAPRLQLVDLSENPLTIVEPGAIDGLGFNAVLDLRKTDLQRFAEETFRPILEELARGSGRVYLPGGPSEPCQCSSIAWLAGEPSLAARTSTPPSKCWSRCLGNAADANRTRPPS